MPIKDSIDKAVDSQLKVEAEITNKGASGQIGKVWSNGWGLFAYAKSKYDGWKKTEAGVKITKDI